MEITFRVCGYVQKRVVEYISDSNRNDTGNISNSTDPDTNTCRGNTVLTKFELTASELSTAVSSSGVILNTH